MMAEGAGKLLLQLEGWQALLVLALVVAVAVVVALRGVTIHHHFTDDTPSHDDDAKDAD